MKPDKAPFLPIMCKFCPKFLPIMCNFCPKFLPIMCNFCPKFLPIMCKRLANPSKMSKIEQTG